MAVPFDKSFSQKFVDPPYAWAALEFRVRRQPELEGGNVDLRQNCLELSGEDCQINCVCVCLAFGTAMPLRYRLTPGRIRACAQDTHRAAAQQVPLNVERVVDCSVRLEKSLRRSSASTSRRLSVKRK